VSEVLFKNAAVCVPGGGRRLVSVAIRGSRVVAIDPPTGSLSPFAGRTVDAGGRLLTPGLVDLHTHGNAGFLFEESAASLVSGIESLARLGVTTVLPTLYQCTGPERCDRITTLVEALDRCRIRVPGFHFEGPFLKLGGAGSWTLDGDMALLDRLLDLADGRMAAMSISPDTKDILPLIERLRGAGVKVFMTHTGADVAQTTAAIDAGASHATHFYDVFPTPPETDPGVRPVGCVETVLADPRVSVDFIADGVHVDPMAIRMALQVKDRHQVIAITDANAMAGLKPGVYKSAWGAEVRLDGHAARIQRPGHPTHGALVGSTLTMPQAIANLKRWLDVPEADVWAMASESPARLMGWEQRGCLTEGFEADLVLWDETDAGDFSAYQTWVDGQCVFDRRTSDASENDVLVQEPVDV